MPMIEGAVLDYPHQTGGLRLPNGRSRIGGPNRYTSLGTEGVGRRLHKTGLQTSEDVGCTEQIPTGEILTKILI